MKRIITICILSFFVVYTSGNCALAKGKKPPEVKDTSIEGNIASHLNLDKSRVVSLRNMGYNDEEIIRILLLNITTEKTTFQISKLYKEGTKWSDIADKYGVDPVTFNKETINMMIYLGLVEKTEPIESNILDDVLIPPQEQK